MGQEGVSPREKGREGQEKRGREAGGQRWQEPGEIEKYFAIEMGQRIGNQVWKGAGSRSKRYRKREVKTPLSPPTNNGCQPAYIGERLGGRGEEEGWNKR